MSGKQGALSSKPTELPAKFDRAFPWQDLDRRCAVARECAQSLLELWQDLGGFESLSTQQRWLCERAIFIRCRMVAYESALMANMAAAPGVEPQKLPMDSGTYSNFASVFQGYMRTLGIDRRARTVNTRKERMASSVGHLS